MNAVDVKDGELVLLKDVLGVDEWNRTVNEGLEVEGQTCLHNLVDALDDGDAEKFVFHSGGRVHGVLISPERYAAFVGVTNLSK